MFPWLSRWQPQLLAVLRIVVALLFLEHSLIKLIGFPPGAPPGLQAVGSLLWIAGIDRDRYRSADPDRSVHSARSVRRIRRNGGRLLDNSRIESLVAGR